MKASDFRRAFALANSDTDLSAVDDSILYGCGLPTFTPVVATLEMVAKLIRWQCWRLDGQWDGEALNEMRDILKRKVVALG